ncbi:tetratricopeptide repeat protein [Micromonospora sp. DT15]|uniref:tetratricopeptide repeat protein n=1 Tax=Micromonospora sp. DT15 TaxID=3393445 RepID=UPI003CE6DF3D
MSGEGLFAFSGADRDIFIIALRNFSDACQLPRLTPECPFYEPTSNGPSCGEQCHDLLAEWSRLAPPPTVISLGDGLELIERRRRHRRGPEPTARPFDAGEIRLHDQERPTNLRHTVSLIVEFDNQLRIPPSMADDVDERRYLIRASLQELVRRGFDRDDLMEVAVSITTTGMIAYIAAEYLMKTVGSGASQNLELNSAWLAFQGGLLAEIDPAEPEHAFRVFIDPALVRRVRAWNKTQSLEDLSMWVPPPATILSGHFERTPASVLNRGKWIIDRFTKTYLAEWSTASLHLEWNYIHSSEPGCAARPEMDLRRLDVNDVAREISKRTVNDQPGRDTEPSAVQLQDFTAIAVDFLESGRFESAVAIYEGLERLRPSDNLIVNNLGFCLMPIDASRALATLKRSAEIAPAPTLETCANLTLAHFLVNDYASAIMTAKAASDISGNGVGWFWIPDDKKQLTLQRVTDVKGYVQSLVDRVRAAQASIPTPRSMPSDGGMKRRGQSLS